MFNWRITKYDPKFRDASGRYKKNEWTSSSDIGKLYEGIKFSFNDYISVENAYVNAILLFMDCMQISAMCIVSLEKHEVPENSLFQQKDMLKVLHKIKNNQNINKETISIASRLVLQEYIWCKLEAPGMYVHFGYDYYMYIGTSKECNEAKTKIAASGLFIEAYKSPYL